MPDLPVLYMETVAAAAIVRLRAAIDAAGPDDALSGLHLPKHRFEKPDLDRHAAIIHVRAAGQRGAGLGHELPAFATVGTLEIHGLIGASERDALTLSTRASALVAAINDVLLEDSSFLLLFAWVDRVDASFEDGKLEGSDRAVIMFAIEIDVGFQIDFSPRVPAPHPLTVELGLQVGPSPEENVHIQFVPGVPDDD